MMRTLLPVVLLALSACRGASAGIPAAAAPDAAPGGARTAYLVRHAEKVDESADPSLSDAGRARAAALRERMRTAGITAIVVSERRRTAETAEPLALQLGLRPIVAGLAGGTDAHVAEVAAAVRRAWAETPGAVLVVGHSNTVPLVARALGAAAAPDLCDSEYASVFVVERGSDGRAVFRRESYGAPDPATRRGCPTGMRPE